MLVICRWPGAMIDGTATLLGGALALGILQDTFAHQQSMSPYQQISFLQWTQLTLPTVMIMLLIAASLIMVIAHKSKVDIQQVRKTLLQYQSQLGRISQRGLITLAVLVVTIGLWVFYGTQWGLDWIALLGVILFFVFKVTSWQ